jgi:predicted nucleic acid-binding protein
MRVILRGKTMPVIDASLAVWAVLPVVAGKGVDVTERLEEWHRAGERLVAPMLWWAECTSAVSSATDAGIISEKEGLRALSDLVGLEVDMEVMDEAMCVAAFGWARRLGQKRAYDGFYLALAEQLGMQMWTADRRLANGVRQVGVEWVRWVGEP